VTKYGKETLSSANEVASSIEEHNTSASQIHTNLVNEAQQLASSTKEALESGIHTLQERGESSRSLFDKIQADDESESKLFKGLEQELQTAHSAFENQMTSWRSTVQVALTQSCTQTGTTIKAHNATVEQSVDGLHSALEEVVRKARQFLTEQRNIVAEMKQSADQQSSSEVARLKEENAWLSSIVDEERKKAEASKDQLIHRISGLLGSFLQERDASLRAAVEDVKESHNGEAEASQAYYSQQDKRMLGLGEKSKMFESTVQMGSREGKRKREIVDEVCFPSVFALFGPDVLTRPFGIRTKPLTQVLAS
jgi:kinesin family member 11